MANDRPDSGDRPRDRHRERDEYRDSRNGGRDSVKAPEDRRNRSRSPRRERGGRRDRYRSRSPIGRGDRDRRERGDKNGDRNDRRQDRDRDPRDFRSNREPPKGPRNAPAGPKRDLKSGGPPKLPTGPRAVASPPRDQDVQMEEPPRRERPPNMDDETWEMAQVMGFARFKSTKNTKVPGNDRNYGVRKENKMEARQYMNRQGGFNRPLSPSRG